MHAQIQMPGIDPKETNMCCAAMLHCGSPVGVVVRVQTNTEKHMISYVTTSLDILVLMRTETLHCSARRWPFAFWDTSPRALFKLCDFECAKFFCLNDLLTSTCTRGWCIQIERLQIYSAVVEHDGPRGGCKATCHSHVNTPQPLVMPATNVHET
jgi:hypothetical protein